MPCMVDLVWRGILCSRSAVCSGRFGARRGCLSPVEMAASSPDARLGQGASGDGDFFCLRADLVYAR